MTNYKQLCAELANELDHNRQCLLDDRRLTHPLADKARAALAEPEPEVPTRRQLMMLADDMGMASVGDAAEYGRAVLARWGNHPALQPVPVSERLPGPEDCDAEGRCWLGGEQLAPGDSTWILGFHAWAKRFPEIHRYWLPAHALPLPSSGEGEA